MQNKIETQWNLIPTYTVDVGLLSHPYEICQFMQSNNIDKYLYRINFKGIVLKYGMSADKSKNFGERLYRQIAHAESWGSKLRNSGHSGADWRIVEEDFYNRYGSKIDKEYLHLKIWNITNYPFLSTNPRNEILRMENELIERYSDIVGEKPIGNIHDEANIKTKGLVPAEVVKNLFYFE